MNYKLHSKTIVNLILAISCISCSAQLPGTGDMESINKQTGAGSFDTKYRKDTIEDSYSDITYQPSWNEEYDSEASSSTYRYTSLLENESDALNYQPEAWNIINDSKASGGSYSVMSGQTQGSQDIIDNNPSGTGLIYSEGKTKWVHHPNNPASVSYNNGQPLIIKADSPAVKYGSGNKFTRDKQYIYNKNNKNSNIEITFTGTNIELWGTKGRNFGKLKITVFDKYNKIEKVIDNVDRYERNKRTSVIAKIQGLKSGKHKVRIESTGVKNHSSSGMTVDFHKALVYPSLQYTFNGTGIKYYAWIANTYGKADIILDGGNPERVDLYGNNKPKYENCPSSKDDDYREREKIRDKDEEDDDGGWGWPWNTKSNSDDDDGGRNNHGDNDDDGRSDHNDNDDDGRSNHDNDDDGRSSHNDDDDGGYHHGNDNDRYCKEKVNNVQPVPKLIKEYTGLTNTEHRITIEATGDKNNWSKGYAITFDKFEKPQVVTTPGFAPSVEGTFELAEPEDDGGIVIMSVDTNGNTALNENNFNLKIVKGPAFGLADLYIDDTLNQTIDFYNPDYSYETVSVDMSSFNTQGLKPEEKLKFTQSEDENLYHFSLNSFTTKDCYSYCPPETNEHTFRLVAKNEKNTASAGVGITFDALDTTLARYKFSGTDFDYIATRKSDQGIVELYVDEQLYGTYDLYSQETKYQDLIISVKNLSRSEHTIHLKPTGKKNPASSGYYINLDSFNTYVSTQLKGQMAKD